MGKITKPIIPMISKKLTGKEKDEILEKGRIGDLNIAVMKRGVIHIWNKTKYPNILFKKDPELFQEELDKIDFAELAVGESVKIEGSGDNDHLIFKLVDGNLVPSLEKRKFGVISKIESFIKRAKELTKKPKRK